MRAALSATILFCLLICTVPLLAQPADSNIEVYPYNDHLVRYFYNVGFTFNVLALSSDDGLLVVDTGFPVTGKEVVDAIHKQQPGEIKAVIISHTHVDHTGGLPAFPKDALVYASAKGMTSSYFDLPDRPTFTRTTVPITADTTIHFGGETIELIPIPMGHYKDEMIIRFVESNVVYVGSRVMPGTWPYIDPMYGDIDEVVERIGILANAYPTATFAVAHGPDFTAEQMVAYQEMLRNSVSAVRAAMDEGKTPKEIAGMDILSPYAELNDGPIPPLSWITSIIRDYNMDAIDKRPPSIAQPLSGVLVSNGVDAMTERYYELKANHADEYDFSEAQLNQLGYELSYRNRFEDALAVLKLNAAVFDSSANVYDSIGEIQLLMGDTTAAIESYERALEKNPEYQNSIQVLERLRK